jgi:hypothetical protein
MKYRTEDLASALVDAFTDGGGSFPELPEIGQVLRENVTVESFVNALHATSSARWAGWAAALGINRPTPADVRRVVLAVSETLEPLSGIPVITVEVNEEQ